MNYRIKEGIDGYYTIYEIKLKNSLFFGSKVIEERMYINYISKNKWVINGQFKSEDECIEFLRFNKEETNKVRVNKIINV